MWDFKFMGERSTFWFLFFTSEIFAAAAKKANRLPRILITSLLKGKTQRTTVMPPPFSKHIAVSVGEESYSK